MGNKTKTNYYHKIKVLLSPEEFKTAENELTLATNECLESFWHIIVAGYSVDFALTNYLKLCNYISDKVISHSEALVTYAFYPGMDGGMYVSKTQWYELN